LNEAAAQAHDAFAGFGFAGTGVAGGDRIEIENKATNTLGVYFAF
jgi:hypothetical protein